MLPFDRTSAGVLCSERAAQSTHRATYDKIGITLQAVACTAIGSTEAAYFKKINAEGGINGRKINFISYDDAYSPPKTVEQAASS